MQQLKQTITQIFLLGISISISISIPISMSKEEEDEDEETEEVPNLPRDLTVDILSRLPIKSILRFRCVSKPWRSLIASPHFINFHFTRSHPAGVSTGAGVGAGDYLLLYHESYDYSKDYYSLRCTDTFAERMRLQFPFKSVHGYVRIVGSGRGLICLFDTNYYAYVGNIILWNPIIRKFKTVPNSHQSRHFLNTFSHIVVGFGFVSEINDYKVVQILYVSNTEDIMNVLVYELGTNSWRIIDAIAPCYIPNCWSSSVYVNGSVHWKAFKKPMEGTIYNSIMSFDMVNEKFGEIGLPENLRAGYDQMHLALSPCGSSLSLSFHFQNGVAHIWELWSMMEYGVVKSWTNQITIDQSQISRPVCFMNNGELFVALYNGKLVSFDPDSQQVKDHGISGLPSSFCVVPYMKSLALV